MKSKNQKGLLRISPGGPINRSNLAEMATAFQANLAKASEGIPVELDLTETEDVDSATLNFLLAASVECSEAGSRLSVLAHPKTADFLNLLKMTRHAEIIPGKGIK